MTLILSETRERLLKAIIAQVPPERIAEIHFFAPIKQAGVESGVAVVAAVPESIVPATEPADAEVSEPAVDAAAGDEDVGTPDGAAKDTSSQRHVIYTARYRYTLKGPDRGKWETNVKAEADAPLITVETVVRGVQRRVGDVDEPDRVSGDEIRAVTDAWASAAMKLPATAPAPR